MVLWEEMKILLLRQFRTTQVGSFYEQWLALEQDGFVQEYRRRIIKMIAPLENIFDDLAVGKFIGGLRPEIAVEQRVFEPNSLGRAMELAQKIEAKIHVMERKKGGLNPMSLQGLPTSHPSVDNSRQHHSSTSFATNQCLTSQIWQLMESEVH